MIQGEQARVFCGPAKATVKIGARTVTFANGTCERYPKGFELQLGTLLFALTGSGRKKLANLKLPYLGLSVGKVPFVPNAPPAAKDGTYTSGGFHVWHAGVEYIPVGPFKITLKNRRTAGTFTGTAPGGRRITGSFTC